MQAGHQAQTTNVTGEPTMKKTYAGVMQQIETLQAEAEKLRRQEVQGVIQRIREAIAAYGLSAADLGFGGRGRRAKAAAAPKARAPRKGRKGRAAKVKFRDEAGNTWGGRGPRPRWLREALAAGKSLSDFAV